MTPRVYCGTFEAEAYWREPDLARLPSLPDLHASQVVQAMDEMLFAFCDAGDCVLTARRMNEAHAQYLRALEFPFNRNDFDLWPVGDPDTTDGSRAAPSVFLRMQDDRVRGQLVDFFPEGAGLEPFAVVPGTAEVATQYGLAGVFPSQAVIRAVNTKSHALQMRDRLGVPNVGVIVDDVASLSSVGRALLRNGPFLVKDEYGVSGKGNQLIGTEAALHRIAKYLSRQSAQGKRVRFVLEPYLQKRSDFSCQFRVEQDGRMTVISLQELINNGLAFGTSCSARPALIESLEREGYFKLIERIGGLMHEDGYWGDVCVDSMVLQNGELAPLVEINARKSMSLIKHAIDRYLSARGLTGCLTYVSVVNDRSTEFSALLERLEKEDLLFTTARGRGILPLTAGTAYGSSAVQTEEPIRGRLYLAVICKQADDRVALLTALSRVMDQAGLHVTH